MESTVYSTNPFFVDTHIISDKLSAEQMFVKSMPKLSAEQMFVKSMPKSNFKEYEPKKIIYNGKATVVFWKDGTKTVVKMAEGTTYSKYNAFCAALAKKIFGSNSAVNRTVANGIEQK